MQRVRRQVEAISAPEPYVLIFQVEGDASSGTDQHLVIRMPVLAIAEAGSIAPTLRNQALRSKHRGDVDTGLHRGEATGRR